MMINTAQQSFHAAALINAVEIANKELENISIVINGAACSGNFLYKAIQIVGW